MESALLQLRDAYLYTGKLKYAQAGIVVLDRVADVYPALDRESMTGGTGSNSHGLPLKARSSEASWSGDSDSAGNPNLLNKLEAAVDAFERTGEPLFAQLAYLVNGNSAVGLRGGLFFPDPKRVLKAIKQAIAEHGPFQQTSSLLRDYGFAALRDGAGGKQRGVWMYQG